MPDKEFDNLFRDKFKDAEIEPSANLWANIESELEPKRKRVFPIYWMAAASVAIAITAMLVFQKEDILVLHGKDPIASVVAPTVELPTAGTSTRAIRATTAQPSFASTTAKSAKGTENKAQKNNLINIQQAVQPKEEIAHLDIKRQDPKPIDVLPIKEAVAVEAPVMTAAVQTPNTVETSGDEIADNSAEHKGIRNVGDLVNYVVDKVDKRDRKLLKFNTDNDDESSLIGINIGFIKLNSKKHKQN